jgi:thiol-disulfide isomerase/thioredoxin
MLALGTPAPDFSLPDVVTGRNLTLAPFAGKPLLVMFICHHCPFVKHIKGELSRIGNDYAGQVAIVGISSNDPAVSSDDSPQGLTRMVNDWGLGYPVCYDESQAVAKVYQAACTPDFFLFDAKHKLAYRGQLDGSRPSNTIPVNGVDLRAALDAVLGGKAVASDQRPSLGCNIKWRPGNAPEYA